MPSVSERQRRFMGAELGRLREGKPTETGMSEQQLREFASKDQEPEELDPDVLLIVARILQRMGVGAVDSYLNKKYPKVLSQTDQANDWISYAFDKESVRHIDEDGHMHIDITPISKANVCGYYGHEIPGWRELGLDGDKIYRMWRDPKELGSPETIKSFNKKPLLFVHEKSTAEDHPKEVTIGTVGESGEFDGTYLKNSLAFWTQDAIDMVESAERKELSAAYHFIPVMEPGVTPDGTPYDGRMTEIRGNHVAIVERGRAGPDVAVGDMAIARKDTLMQKSSVSDRKKLARDIETFGSLEDPGVKTPPEPPAANPLEPPTDAPPDEPKPEEPAESPVKMFLREKLSPEDFAHVCQMLEEGDAGSHMPRAAMDEAIRRASDAAVARAIKVQKAIRNAEKAVRPYVGDLAHDADDESGVYRAAVHVFGIDTNGIHPDAYRPIFEAQVRRKETGRRQSITGDTARTVKAFDERFPDAGKIKIL